MNRAIWSLMLLTFALVLPSSAHAYIDPATTTYIVQIVSAVVITLGVTIGVFFTRIRMFFLNARVRIAEWRVSLFSRKKGGSQGRRVAAGLQQYSLTQTGKWSLLWADNRSYPQRLVIALLLSAGIIFTFVVFAVFDLYVVNVHVFTFRLMDVYGTVLLLAAGTAAVLALIISLLRGRLFDIVVSILLGVLIAGYAQGNLLNISLGELTGDAIPWQNYRMHSLKNLAIWLVLLGGPLVLRFFWKKFWLFIVRFLPLLLVTVQLISMISQSASGIAARQPNTEMYLSDQGLYEVGKKQNIIVFILDRLDNRYIEEIVQSDPKFFDVLTGFTRFTNNTTMYSQTFPSVANMLTGEQHLFTEPQEAFLTRAFTTSTFLPILRENGFAIKLYTEPRYAFGNAADLSGFTENVLEGRPRVRKLAATRQFLTLSAFRYAPFIAKPFFWVSTDMFGALYEMTGAASAHVTDDIQFLADLRSERLRLSNPNKNFLFIHLNGSHSPYNMDEHGNRVPEEKSNARVQTMGSFRIVCEYLSQLKDLGLYENSTIIITGDHGSRKDDTEYLDTAMGVGLFVKPAGASTTPLALNAAPVSSDNFRAAIYKAAGLDYTAIAQDYFEVSEDAKGERYLYHRLIASNTHPSRLLTYRITGDVNDFSNWHLVDENVIKH